LKFFLVKQKKKWISLSVITFLFIILIIVIMDII